MVEEETNTPAPEPEEKQELEFRPWVLWTGVGVAAAASLGLLIFTYVNSFDKGYHQGYAEGDAHGFNRAIESKQVHEQLNRTAEQNVLSFMRLYSASDEVLLQAAADTGKTFAWIQDAGIRLEAEWFLVDALMQRNLVQNGMPLLDKLVAAVPHTKEWAHRIFRAATWLNALQHGETATKYYLLAASLAAENSMPELREDALGHVVAFDLSSPLNTTQALALWKQRYTELKNMGNDTKHLRSLLLVHMGEQFRTRESRASAEKLYRAALEGVDLAQVNKAEYAACYGTALLELGDVAAAEPLLLKASGQPGSKPVEIAAHLLALRKLATIELGRDNHASALTLLQRAHGVAAGRVHASNTFWPCLFDQRGWLQFMAENYSAAAQDFKAALSQTEEPILQIQPLEGTARCHMETQELQPAQTMLEKCLALRKKHIPADKSSLGRIYLLLGQVYDLQGKTADAESAYGSAVSHLTADTQVDQDNKLIALLGQAHALTELRRWNEAHAAWESLMPLLDGQPDREDEARDHMERIAPYLTPQQPAEDSAQQ